MMRGAAAPRRSAPPGGSMRHMTTLPFPCTSALFFFSRTAFCTVVRTNCAGAKARRNSLRPTRVPRPGGSVSAGVQVRPVIQPALLCGCSVPPCRARAAALFRLNPGRPGLVLVLRTSGMLSTEEKPSRHSNSQRVVDERAGTVLTVGPPALPLLGAPWAGQAVPTRQFPSGYITCILYDQGTECQWETHNWLHS